MTPSQTHILELFAKLTGLELGVAQETLTSIARAIYVRIPPASVVEQRKWLLHYVEELARNNKRQIRRLEKELRITASYLAAAARSWLDQADADARTGLSRDSSVYVEIGKLAGPARPEPVSSGSQPTSAPSGSESQTFSIDEEVPHRPTFSKPPLPRSSAPGSWFGRMLGWRGSTSSGPAFPSSPSFAPGPPTSPITLNDPGVSDDFSEHGDDAAPSPAAAQEFERLHDERPAQDADEYRVWFATNRKPDNRGGFSNERSIDVSHGFCDVYIPESHKMGSLGSSFLTRLVTRTDDRLKLRRTCVLSDESLWQLIKAQLSTVEPSQRQAVVFIHGYNVSFEEAALRAAQMGDDLGIGGAMAFFSWPSRGKSDAYPADESSIEASELAITDFLVEFAKKTEAQAVHVIAHSMGNRALLRAVNHIVEDAQRRAGLQFANFILAAPDIDVDTFRNFAGAYAKLAHRTTLYISKRDRALGLSAWIHNYPRVGFAPPVTVFEGIDTVNVTNVDLDTLGHGYVGKAKPVLSDMHNLIFHGLAPSERFSLRAESTETGLRYWEVHK